VRVLVVLATEVGDAAGWWLAAECGVAAVVIVVVEPVGEGGDAVGFGGVGVCVGPFVEQGPAEPLDAPMLSSGGVEVFDF
jgi:hypothetical protein